MFLCVLSENAYSSQFVLKELEYAIRRNDNIVLPVIVDNSQLPEIFKSILSTRKITYWQFKGHFNVRDVIISDVARALGLHNEHLSNAEKENNALLARNRQEGTDNYNPQELDVDIFISYRRLDGRDYARNIMQALKIVGYPQVFFRKIVDVENCKNFKEDVLVLQHERAELIDLSH